MSCGRRARNQIRRKFYQDRLRSDLGTALELALTDPLTGLYNQRYLRRHLSGLMETGQGRNLAVLMVDVDHFKSVNDRFGHASGDRALRLIADSLREIPEYSTQSHAMAVRNSSSSCPAQARPRPQQQPNGFGRLSKKLNLTHQVLSAIPLTVSVGVACTPTPSMRP